MIQHHFPNICVDKSVYDKVDCIKDFVKISRQQSELQTYYHSPTDLPRRGPDKYFGDAGEYFTEVLLGNSQIDKGINCSSYIPTKIDEFGIDGRGLFTINSGFQLPLGVQVKISTDKFHRYDSQNSNIMTSVAAIPVFGLGGVLFVNFGAGIKSGLLQTLNQTKPNLVRQLNYDDLDQLTYKNTTFWDLFREGLG